MTEHAMGPLRKGSVFALLGGLMLVAAPHAQRLPAWIVLAIITLLAWRGWLAWRNARLPDRWVLVVIAVAMSAGVIATYVPVLRRDASVALLAVMLGLKCLELRTLRDAIVVICLGYFLIITNFLYSQTMATALFMVAAMIWLTATMVSFQDHGRRLAPQQAARLAAVLLAQAAPLMLALFLFFPRIQGPVFGFPQATSTGVTGLTDTMSPGDLANLGLSDEVAFRVQFHTPPPKTAALYWRGPVLWDFDGRTWMMAKGAPPALHAHEIAGDPVRYTVTLEPHHRRWLFAIDLPDRPPSDAMLTDDYQILANRPVRVRERYEMSSHPSYRLGLEASPTLLRRALRLPPGFNPRSVELAQAIRARSADDVEVVDNVLDLFRGQLFFYTLVPPALGRDSVDEFLFQTRRGFCEHYASAFVFLMRAAGVPARVVTGYQGGEMNPMGNYLLVRQSEAHAWGEVWIRGQGWKRVDPTAAVSPARIEVGLAAAVPQSDPLPVTVRGAVPLLKQLRFTLDAITNAWNQWVLGYTPDRQLQLMQRVGLGKPTWQTLTVLLMCIAGAVVLGLTALILLRLRGMAFDPVHGAYRRFCRKLARVGMARAPAEGPRDFARRLSTARPAIAVGASTITELYVGLRYGNADPAQLRVLRELVRKFRP